MRFAFYFGLFLAASAFGRLLDENNDLRLELEESQDNFDRVANDEAKAANALAEARAKIAALEVKGGAA